MFCLVPFRGDRNELSIGIPSTYVCNDDLGQYSRAMQSLAPTFDAALIRKLPQHALERDTVGIFHAEGPRNLARADFARPAADEGDKLVFGWKRRLPRRGLHGESEESSMSKVIAALYLRLMPAVPPRAIRPHVAFALRAGLFSFRAAAPVFAADR